MPEPDTLTIDTLAWPLPERLRELPEWVSLLQAGELIGLSRNTTYRTAARRRTLELAGQPVHPDRDPEVFPLPVTYLGGGKLPRGRVRRPDVLRYLGYLTAGSPQ